jgi:ActR/RegA family two-component response regulator
VKAPTRALIVEDIDTWVYTLTRAARRAGASEIVSCSTLPEVREALRTYRFDVAILDIGLDPDDDLNSDGIKALETIRETDGGGTRCVLMTGWQGGDRMALQSRAQQEHGVDWAYMKEKYEAHTLIAKLTELLEHAAERRLAQSTAMENLSANMDPPFPFEAQLLDALAPRGGVRTLYSLVSRLLSTSTPVIARQPAAPLEEGPDGVCAGLYWSRALASALAVGLAPAPTWADDEDKLPAVLSRQLPADVAPDLIEEVRERNVVGRLWELPGLTRNEFPG